MWGGIDTNEYTDSDTGVITHTYAESQPESDCYADTDSHADTNANSSSVSITTNLRTEPNRRLPGALPVYYRDAMCRWEC